MRSGGDFSVTGPTRRSPAWLTYIPMCCGHLCVSVSVTSRTSSQSGLACGKRVLPQHGGADTRFWPCEIAYGPWACGCRHARNRDYQLRSTPVHALDAQQVVALESGVKESDNGAAFCQLIRGVDLRPPHCLEGCGMSHTISLMIVEGHQLLGACLGSVLANMDQFMVFDVAHNKEEALNKVRERQPDVVLIDRDLPDEMALTLTAQLTRDFPRVRALIFGLGEVAADIREYVEAGARGYVLKDASIDNLRIAVESIARGETVCSPQITYSMFLRLAELAHQPIGGQTILTTREMEILQLISQGWSNKRIANHLFVSLYTIKNHVHNILKKLQVRRRNRLSTCYSGLSAASSPSACCAVSTGSASRRSTAGARSSAA
jgi:two-component system nitrate/nitrite response regulator NarL